ncbi:PTS sugar transporter subunit IIB [Lacticaseibacillus daqingensis]|uniref:PTS sugar transporter subunit IIB n=1 Tax=Lacticaseibacillus daqingensis TaxID=2486014 RepID=UPI000F770FDE|nr:PTS sugar transporter subunit IIB [Lacticaseibacillus daqingensis]
MATQRIMLCCGAGFSSGFLAQKTRQAAKKQKRDLHIDARSESQVAQYLNNIDVLLLGPHFANQLGTYQEMTADRNITVAVIPANIYGTLDGGALINFIDQLTQSDEVE